MAEKDCDYILIDRADDYLQREFSPLFEGGLTNDMPATLYHLRARTRQCRSRGQLWQKAGWSKCVNRF